MKNIFFVFLIVLLLFTINNNVYSQCASGFTKDTVRITIGNCDYDIVVCFKCQVTNPGEVYIRSITEVDSSCINLLNIEQIIEQAYSEVSKGEFIYGNLCFDTQYDAPPCNDQGTSYKTMKLTYYYCWKVKLVNIAGELVNRYLPCNDNAECTVAIKFCFDVVTGKYEKIGYLYMDPPQDPPCYLEYFQITIPTQVNQESDCFLIHTVPCGVSN